MLKNAYSTFIEVRFNFTLTTTYILFKNDALRSDPHSIRIFFFIRQVLAVLNALFKSVFHFSQAAIDIVVQFENPFLECLAGLETVYGVY